MTDGKTRVRDVMTAQPVTVGATSPVVECAQKMMELGVRHLPVVEEGRLVGVVDDVAVFAAGVVVEGGLWMAFSDDGPTDAQSMMRSAVTVEADALLVDALEQLGSTTKEVTGEQLPGVAVVQEDGYVVGVLSEHDVLTVAGGILDGAVAVTAFASQPVMVVGFDTPVREALQQMVANRVRHMVVTEGGIAGGVLSLRDLVATWKGPDRPVEGLLGRDMETIEPEESIAAAAQKMADLHVGCLPILDRDGKPTHIVTRTDVLAAVGSALEDEALFP
jgi:CBS domain-containing protein